MPTVEKVAGGSVYLQSEAASLSIGDTIDVSGAKAAYLCEERGDFEQVEAEADGADVADEAECSRCGRSHGNGPACWDLIEEGVCPWCDGYEGDGVAQHASAAHPEKWDAYKED